MQTEHTPSIETSTERTQHFAEWILESFNRGAFCLMASVGHRCGLFDAMQHVPAATSHEIAAAAGRVNRRARPDRDIATSWANPSTVHGRIGLS